MFDIITYLESLPPDIRCIDISNKNLTFIPDLQKFKNLKILICCHNKITELFDLPIQLEILDCSYNKLTYLHTLNKNLKKLYCYNNNITYLPDLNDNLKLLECSNNNLNYLPYLNENLEELYCYSNKLTYLPSLNINLKKLYCNYNYLTHLPKLNNNLEILYCFHNELHYLPILPENLQQINYSFNIIYDIINNDDINIINKKINKLNNFRLLYYCLKFKNKFRKILWEKIREPKIKKHYHPKYLLNHLNEDLDCVLDNWINE